MSNENEAKTSDYLKQLARDFTNRDWAPLVLHALELAAHVLQHAFDIRPVESQDD